MTYLMSSPLSVHQSTIFAFFSVWLKFGSISMGRYFSYSFFDPSRNEVGTDLHRLNIPKLDNVGLPLAVICLVSVKSKSVTTCSSFAPPCTMSFIIRSIRCRSRILQCGWFNASISFNWIGRCDDVSVAIVLLLVMCVNVAPIASNCWPTRRLNLYACSAKSKFRYSNNQAFKWNPLLIMPKSLRAKTKSVEQKENWIKSIWCFELWKWQ